MTKHTEKTKEKENKMLLNMGKTQKKTTLLTLYKRKKQKKAQGKNIYYSA